MSEWLRLLTAFAGLLCIFKGASIFVRIVRDNRENGEKRIIRATVGFSVYAGVHVLVGLWLFTWNVWNLISYFFL